MRPSRTTRSPALLNMPNATTPFWRRLQPGPIYPLPIAAWQIGNAIWVCVAGEHYSRLQTTLRQRFPKVLILITTITNGWQPGYLPLAELYGKGIYQESIAMGAPGSVERVIDEIGAQLQRWSDGVE